MIIILFFLEPVPSAGVYIHPSGYCYTVASNGVWYFHDGSSTEEGIPQTPTPELPIPTTQGNSAPLPLSTPNFTHVPPTGMPPQVSRLILHF